MPEPEIRNHLRRLRFERDEMTQQELAERARCTRQTIIALEQGKYIPSLALAFRIARAFDLGVDDVFEYAEGETPATDPRGGRPSRPRRSP
jgi:putative transcriptional regulator